MLTTHKPQRCPATVPASWLPGPLDFRAPGGAGPAASGGVGRGEITSQKTPISSTQQLPNAPHRRDDAQGPNRPRALNQTSPLAAQPRSERRRAGPADLSLCLCLAVTSCPAIRRSLVVERCAIYTSPGSRRPRASEWPRLGIRAHPKVGSQYRGHPLADAPISATPRLPEIGLGGSALLSLALQPGGRATAMATGDSLQQGGGDGRWGFGAVGLMSIPQPVRSRDSVIPVKRAAASSRREAQPERGLAYTPSAQLAWEIQRPHDADLAPSALPGPQGTRSGHGSGQGRRREKESIFSPSASTTIPPFPGRGSKSWRGDAPTPDGEVLRASGEDPHPSIRD